jgi:hypothetical protein
MVFSAGEFMSDPNREAVEALHKIRIVDAR